MPVDLKTLCASLNQIFGGQGQWPEQRPACGKQLDKTSCGAFVVHHIKLLMTGVATTGSNVPVKGKRASQRRDTRLIRSQMARELLNQKLDVGIALASKFYK